MIDPNFLDRLRCPATGQSLQIAAAPLVEQINRAINRGVLRDVRDQKIEVAIEGGLISEDRQRLYPVRDRIPTLIADEAIPLDQLAE